MKLFSWFLFITSALLYALPLIFPVYAWWVSFLFPIPLFYVAVHEKLGFTYGFIWGLLAVSAHLFGVLFGIDNFTTSRSSFLPRLLPGIGLISWSALNHGLVFWGADQIQTKWRLKTSFSILLVWAVALWCDVFFFDRMVLWPFGRMEGYFGFHPILSLATHPQLLTLLPILGKNLLSFFLYLVPASITCFLIDKNKKSFYFVVFASIPWIISLMIPIPHAQKPAWLDKVAIGQTFFSNPGCPVEKQVKNAQEYFKSIVETDPHIDTIILPETAFYCTELNGSPGLIRLWAETFIGKPVNIIFGALRYDGKYVYNTAHWARNGKIRSFFDKRHAVPLTERVPPCLSSQFFHDLFFKNVPEITPSKNVRPLFEITNDLSCTPYICSELFFNDHPDDRLDKPHIVSMTNDRWCTVGSVAELMYLDARLKAMMWQRGVIYASFAYASYFDQYGNEWPLKTFKETKEPA